MLYQVYDIYVSLPVALAFAILFFRIGQIDYGKGYLTGLVSIVLSLGIIVCFHGGVAVLLFVQTLLFIGLWARNFKKKR